VPVALLVGIAGLYYLLKCIVDRVDLPIQLAAFEVLLPYRAGLVGDLPQRLKGVGVVESAPGLC
jgi:hypothetical protein